MFPWRRGPSESERQQDASHRTAPPPPREQRTNEARRLKLAASAGAPGAAFSYACACLSLGRLLAESLAPRSKSGRTAGFAGGVVGAKGRAGSLGRINGVSSRGAVRRRSSRDHGRQIRFAGEAAAHWPPTSRLLCAAIRRRVAFVSLHGHSSRAPSEKNPPGDDGQAPEREKQTSAAERNRNTIV